MPNIKHYSAESEGVFRDVLYLNSGDWVEHLTALEFDGTWSLYEYSEIDYQENLHKGVEKIISQQQPIVRSPLAALRSPQH